MEEVRPTRSELLARREQIKTAEEGMKLLKLKRDAFIAEFMKVVQNAMRQSAAVASALRNARYDLEIAQTVDGTTQTHSVALAANSETYVDIGSSTIMGVTVPQVEPVSSVRKNAFTYGYSPTGVSLRIDDAAKGFSDAVVAIIAYAEAEETIRRLGEEISKINRRVNALEQIRIPELKAQVAYITATLDERSREDLFRLKKVKKNIERNKAKAAAAAAAAAAAR